MRNYGLQEIESWDRFYRANFINSLTGFKSVNLIGTANTLGQTNLSIFSSIVHLGSNPALVGYVNRPIDAAPDTITNIETTGVYTINHIQPFFVDKAHQTSAKYESFISEFEEVGLTPHFIDEFKAPFVQESKVKYGLELQEIIPIKLNQTFFVIGKIVSVYLEENILNNDGFLNLENAQTICSNGIDAYYKTSLIGRYEYAKPNQPLKKIK